MHPLRLGEAKLGSYTFCATFYPVNDTSTFDRNIVVAGDCTGDFNDCELKSGRVSA